MRIALLHPESAQRQDEQAVTRTDANRSPALDVADGLGQVVTVSVSDIASVDGQVADADILLVVFREMPTTPPRWFAKLPSGPRTVVTAPDPLAAAYLLRRFRVHEIVATNDMEEALPVVLRRVYNDTTIARAVRTLETLDRLTPILRRWMLSALRDFPPYYSVKASARKPAAVYKAWQRKIKGSSPKEFLRWVLLVRAAGLRITGGECKATAEKLDVSPGVLNRAAEAVLGCSFEEISVEGYQEIHDRFERYMARSVIRPPR